MTKKSLGYVELDWTCPACGGRNKGNATVCKHCGAPQPEDVKFEQPAEEKIIEDAVVIERAKAGPDIHCAFCGTRNPAGSQICARCGADLGEGVARAKGGIVGAHRDEPAPDIVCPFCATPNRATNLKCSNCGANIHEPKPAPPAPAQPTPKSGGMNKLVLVGIGILIVICFAALFLIFGRTDDVAGQVSNVGWERQIVVLGLAPVSHQDWRDEIPANADLGSCRDEVRYRSDTQQPNSQEVCGTPYTVDTGSGFGEVVQDCEYLVYDAMCAYTTMEMVPVNTLVSSGTGLNPEWPELRLEAEQEQGDSSESYTITFQADGETYRYTTRNFNEFSRFEPGSRWLLKVNALGTVVDVEPAN